MMVGGDFSSGHYFLLLLLKSKAINSGVKGQSPLLYNHVRSRGRMAHKACNQERSYHYG